MIEKILKNAPDSWEVVELNEIGLINPKIEKSLYEDDKVCSFVPMSALEAESGRIDVSETRLFSQVKKGYTPFLEKDVLLAKITPCMENGKVAVVPKLIGDLGFGSTEFHVVRPYSCISESYIFYYLVSQIFRYDAERNMTGAVGQRRVPAPWLSSVKIPLPPQKEQQRIVQKVEELFSELDKGIESLTKAKQHLLLYRQSILQKAVEGKLTEKWRSSVRIKAQKSDSLAEKIHSKRENEYKLHVDLWKVAVENWENNGSKGKKPPKPRRLPKVSPENAGKVPEELPAGWNCLQLKDTVLSLGQGWSPKCESIPSNEEKWGVIKTTAIQNRRFIENENKLLPNNLYPREWLKIEKDDILITRAGPRNRVGIVCRVSKDYPNLMLCDKAYRLRFPQEEVSPNYMEILFNTYSFAQQIEELKTGINDSGLNITQPGLLGLYVPIPPKEEQDVLVEIVDERCSVIDHLICELDINLDKAELLRQSILKKAFSGQLVSQDSEDETASELLKRIAIEKEEMAEKEIADKATVSKKKATAKKTVKS